MAGNLKHENFLATSKPSPSIYVACLASYNAGKLYGKWIDACLEVEDILKEIKQMLATSPMPNAEEFAVHDYEGFYSLRIDESEDIEVIHEKALFIAEYGELGAAVLAYSNEEIEVAAEAMNDRYEGAYKNQLDYATYLFDECHLSSIPESLRYYVDYEAFKRDIFIDDYFSINVQGSCHVFRQY